MATTTAKKVSVPQHVFNAMHKAIIDLGVSPEKATTILNGRVSVMSFTTSFKNLGHYVATGAKYLSTGIEDIVKFANKGQALEPEVSLLAQALAGPTGASITTLAFNALGTIAAAVAPVGTDAASLTTAQSALSKAGLEMDTQTILDVKSAAATIESVMNAIKASKPAAPSALAPAGK